MSGSQSDALVFFGASGDLAYKQIFPALQALVRRGVLDVPEIPDYRLESSIGETGKSQLTKLWRY